MLFEFLIVVLSIQWAMGLFLLSIKHLSFSVDKGMIQWYRIRLVSPETKINNTKKQLNNLCDFLVKLVGLYIDEKPQIVTLLNGMWYFLNGMWIQYWHIQCHEAKPARWTLRQLLSFNSCIRHWISLMIVVWPFTTLNCTGVHT